MPRRTSNPLAMAFAKYKVEATVTEAEQVTPSMRSIRLVADEAIPFHYVPGQHVRVQINDPLSVYGILRPGQTLRTYTIWDFAPEERALELRVHIHGGEGIGLKWAKEVRRGDPVTLWWPQGDFFLREAPYHLFIGEEAASAAFGPMIRALGDSARVVALLESDSVLHDVPIPGLHALRRVHRHGASAVSSQTLLAALAELDLPDGPGAAYVAGEAKTCQMVRDYLMRERQWARAGIKVKPFWSPGKYGLH
ncbi:siderophore-interacting protein [Pendulispora albinea]|uniref:Siderophore-interacting protein n=1 Tax=Pendulispora albinea TaxID=2741071 RepID=A0ABZ2LME9_9BACT